MQTSESRDEYLRSKREARDSERPKMKNGSSLVNHSKTTSV